MPWLAQTNHSLPWHWIHTTLMVLLAEKKGEWLLGKQPVVSAARDLTPQLIARAPFALTHESKPCQESSILG